MDTSRIATYPLVYAKIVTREMFSHGRQRIGKKYGRSRGEILKNSLTGLSTERKTGKLYEQRDAHITSPTEIARRPPVANGVIFQRIERENLSEIRLIPQSAKKNEERGRKARPEFDGGKSMSIA